MIIKRYKNAEVVLLRDMLLIKPDGKTEKVLPKIPLCDICLLTGISKDDIKRDYRNIEDWYDNSIVELLLDNAMVEQEYYEYCQVISFESVLIYKIIFESEQIKISLDSEFLPINIAASILFLSEEAMRGVAKNELEVYNEKYYKMSDFMDYYRSILKARGIQKDVSLARGKSWVSIMITRQITNKTEIK